jgi:tRNA(His) guanylyltransferase
VSQEKHELLFSVFNVNYNNLPEIYRKGSVLYRHSVERQETGANGKLTTRTRSEIADTAFVDIIGDAFWAQNPRILE